MNNVKQRMQVSDVLLQVRLGLCGFLPLYLVTNLDIKQEMEFLGKAINLICAS